MNHEIGEIKEQERLREMQEQHAKELLESTEKLMDSVISTIAEIDGTSKEAVREKMELEVQETLRQREAEEDLEKKLEVSDTVNRGQTVSFGSSTSVCARVRTGTQYYCPLAGSGR